ncbi:long-chain fatty acid--CoA ligase [Streptomyces palmae]|uniref:Long-chain fatty acid--CoA ligase n=1 Tax=Streptomyces palmae TaxID=1701085 RepID=A0A4Z0HCC7_9ACTN|nr:long-chain fatty acid--CoA ligase [Streptomyces palmae]
MEAFRRDPGLPAFEYRGRAVPRHTVLDLVCRAVDALRAAGLGPGSPVALATQVTPQGFAAQIAALLLGCRVTGLRPGLAPVQLRAVLPEMEAIVADTPSAGPELRAAAGAVPVLRLGPDVLDSVPPAGATPTTPDTLAAQGRPDDIGLIHLTSGSTGLPKGCALTYAALTRHWSWQPAQWGPDTVRLAAGYRRFLLFGTLTSAVMFEHLALCLLDGGTAVIPDLPLEFPRAIERYRPTALLMTVPRLHHVLDTLREEPMDTGSLRVLLVAGSPLTPHRLAEARERFGPVVHQGYGQTETGMLTLLTPRDLADSPGELLDSVGRPWAGTELSVRDEHGHPVPTGGTGEVWARTPSAMSGYWRQEERTREVLRDGWVRTRDLGHLDRHGFLRLTGRLRDVIIVNAVTHYAGPIEQALAGHPDVDQAYVVGAPDERTGEAAHAFVVPSGTRTPDLPALRRAVADALGPAAVPATLTVLSEVPVAAGGKPDKQALLALVPARRAH